MKPNNPTPLQTLRFSTRTSALHQPISPYIMPPTQQPPHNAPTSRSPTEAEQAPAPSNRSTKHRRRRAKLRKKLREANCSASSLCVSWPFSAALAQGYKGKELRKHPLPDNKVNKRVFIHETLSPTKDISGALDPPKSWQQQPGRLIGSAIFTNGGKINPKQLTKELASCCFLSHEGLLKAYKKGYVFIWVCLDPRPVRSPPPTSLNLQSKGMGVTWTHTSNLPPNYNPLPLTKTQDGTR